MSAMAFAVVTLVLASFGHLLVVDWQESNGVSHCREDQSEFFRKDESSALVLPCYAFFPAVKAFAVELWYDFAPCKNCQKLLQSPGESRHLLFISDKGEEPCRWLFFFFCLIAERLKVKVAPAHKDWCAAPTRNVTFEKCRLVCGG